jgi:flavin-dependent dehydrogenase
LSETDVIVAGGGASGLAAAVTAAQNGIKTILIERYGFFGGMAVAGLSGPICGLFSSSASEPLRQIVHGFAGKFARLLKERGGLTEPYPFGKTALCVHDPLKWKETADGLVRDAGVHVLFHTIVTDVIMEENRIAGVIVENKSGRSAIRAKAVVDATEDGDVAAKAGAPYSFG